VSSTRDAGLRVLVWLCLSILTLPRGAAAQVCSEASLDYLNSVSLPSGGTEPREMALGRFNLDEFPDVAVHHSGSDEVGILLGDGSGFGLQISLSYPAPISDVVAADFDHDGWDDVAVSVTSRTGHRILLSGEDVGGLLPVNVKAVPSTTLP
jgi:hypothetical protein